MNRKIFIISVIVFGLDQIVKAVLGTILTLGKSIPVINDFFNITLYHNYGAGWGFLEDQRILILIGTFLALVLIYRYMYSFKMNKRNIVAFGLLTGGIIGNFADRLVLGYVVDFFDFYIFGYDFPIFNVADIAIIAGVILLIIAIFKGEDKIAKDKS